MLSQSFLHRLEAFASASMAFRPVTSAGFKPTTFGTGIRRSIQLNYEAAFFALINAASRLHIAPMTKKNHFFFSLHTNRLLLFALQSKKNIAHRAPPYSPCGGLLPPE